MGANSPPGQELTPGQRTEARAEHERRLLDEGIGRLLASRVAQGLPCKGRGSRRAGPNRGHPAGHEREQPGHGAGSLTFHA